jgi:hypothetical protein
LRSGGGGRGFGKGLGGAASAEGDGRSGNGPTGGGDFDGVALRVGEIEEDGIGAERIAGGRDAEVDGAARGIGICCEGLEHFGDGAEGVGREGGFVLGEEGAGEPFLEEAGAEGLDVVGEAGGGSGGAGEAFVGEEGAGEAAGVLEEAVGYGGMGRWHIEGNLAWWWRDFDEWTGGFVGNEGDLGWGGL